MVQLKAQCSHNIHMLEFPSSSQMLTEKSLCQMLEEKSVTNRNPTMVQCALWLSCRSRGGAVGLGCGIRGGWFTQLTSIIWPCLPIWVCYNCSWHEAGGGQLLQRQFENKNSQPTTLCAWVLYFVAVVPKPKLQAGYSTVEKECLAIPLVRVNSTYNTVCVGSVSCQTNY